LGGKQCGKGLLITHIAGNQFNAGQITGFVWTAAYRHYCGPLSLQHIDGCQTNARRAAKNQCFLAL
jgi:hypothetical protein